LSNYPSNPPNAEKSRSQGGVRKFRLFNRPLFAAATYSFLFLLISAGGAFLLSRGRSDVSDNAQGKPAAAPIPDPPELRQVSGTFESRQTVTDALTEHGVSFELTNQIVECARPMYDLAKVRAGQSYGICFTQEGDFRDFRYAIDDERYLTVYNDAGHDRLIPVIKSFPFETRVERVTAVINDSLFSAVMDIGESDQLALDLADIFASDIDFYTDIRDGDSFNALVEKKYLDGRFTKYGAVLAAEFTNDQKIFAGYRFQDENGKPAYFAADGKSLKRSFLKSPLKFARISSRFSRARMHPILKVLRPHLGVDYAARIGTPVQAVGAGVVTVAGLRGGNGKMVRIRHSGGFETMYLHLSKIAVKAGVRVAQGQVIGNVGSTGLSTGPHLDFRVYRHGKAINPLKVIFPPGAPVQPKLLESFAALRDKLNHDLKMTDSEMSHLQ
jgi:murein DD-endopeptidase MepM/ murein hydrolase activator NlpD